MRLATPLLLVLLVPAATALAADKKADLNVSYSASDPRTHLSSRHTPREARLAIETRSGAATLLLLGDVVAVQLSDKSMASVKPKEDANFLEEWIVAGVRLAVGKSVEYPLAHIRSAEVRDGALVLTSDEGKPVFDDVTVNGNNVTHDLTAADAARFVNAFRAMKTRR